MKGFIKKRLREEISASEAYNDLNSIQTLIDKKRNVAFIGSANNLIANTINDNGLLSIAIPRTDDPTAYIVYRQGAGVEANELLKIANKYGGYLSPMASDIEQRRIGQLLGYKRSDVEEYIARLQRRKLSEEMIDGQNMNQGAETVCNKMSVATYDEGIKLITAAIGTPEQNPKMWQRISKPLNNWKQENTSIGDEVKTMGMSGDSMVDESNTWWTAIQTTICEQGPDFQ